MKKLSLFPLRFLFVLILTYPLSIVAQSDSVSASAGTNVHILPYDSLGSINIQSEVHISVNKNNPNNLIVSANTYVPYILSTNRKNQGFYYSHDGGATWVGDDVLDVDSGGAVGGDPSTAIDANGHMYISTMNPYGMYGYSEYYLNVSTDSGATWRITKNPYGYTNSFDKEMLAADDDPSSPHTNNIYCVFYAVTSIKVETYIPSRDTFLSPTTVIAYSPTDTLYPEGPDIQVGLDGNVFVCWAIECNNNTAPHKYTRGFGFAGSNSGGSSFSFVSPYKAVTYTGSDRNGQGSSSASDLNFNGIRVNSYPSMGIDKSCGAHRGRIYVTFSDVVSGNDVVQVCYSDSNGKSGTWSSPATVSISPSHSRSFFPRITIDDITGAVCIAYYNFPMSGSSGVFSSTNTYMAYSIDGSTYNNVKVSNSPHEVEPIDNTIYSGNVAGYSGDYIGLVAYNGIAYPAWMDNRTDTMQIYFAKVTIGPYKIATNTTWSSSQTMQTDVEVTPSKTLTIDSGVTIKMGGGHRIIVDSGAVLHVSGTLTNSGDCWNSSLWAGIQLGGNASQVQNGTHQGTLILDKHDTIENAVNGVSTAGGIIVANHATFYNNQCDVSFSAYSKYNRCSFTACNFKTDQNYIWLSGSHPYPLAGKAHVMLNNVNSILFRGNRFVDSIPTSGTPAISVNFERGSGILSMDATYAVDNCNCSYSSPPGGCCGTGNLFKGLYFGILASNSNSFAPIQVSGNTFTNNYADIDITDMNEVVITNNTFTKTAFVGSDPTCIANCYPPYNIYLDQCTGYNVSANSMSNTYSAESYGTVINNSGSANNHINNNSYSGIYVQSQSQSTNGFVNVIKSHSPAIIAYPLLEYSGLQYQCNTYSSTVASGVDISVASGLIDPHQGSCVSSSTTANNTFNNACSTPDDRLNIYTYASIPTPWYIFYDSAHGGPGPHCWSSGTVFPSSCGSISSSNCTAATYTINVQNGNLLNAQSINYHATFRTQKSAIIHKKDSLTGVLNRGNTPGLFTTIATGTATVILDSLLAPGPYLSDSVLKTAIRKTTIPIETLADILIPNTPLDSSVVSTLDGIGLPDTLVSRLNEYQSDDILSERSILLAGIDYFQALMDFTDNALITALVTDTTVVHGYDSAQAVIKSNPALTLPQLAQLASLQWAAGENTTALVTLDTLKKHDVDSTYAHYRKLLPVLITLRGNSNGYLSLKGNSTDSTLIAQIAMDTLTPGYANARAVMGYVYNKPYAEPILPLTGSHRPFKRSSALLITTDATNSALAASSLFRLFPNPAYNQLNIQYSLGNNSTNAYVELFDEVGNKVTTWQLSTSQTRAVENITNLSPGFYFYDIFVNNKPVQRGKLVIAR